MTLDERLSRLESAKRLNKIPVEKDNINIIFIKANRAYLFADSLITSGYKNNYNFDNRIFLILYDAIRLGFVSLLMLYGYKTNSTGGAHSYAFDFGKDILIEELNKTNKDEEESDNIKSIYRRINKIIQDRNDDMYEPIDDIISRTDLTALMKDINYLLSKIKNVIDNYK